MVSAIVIVTPGPDMALTLHDTLLGGIATALGISVGQLIRVAGTSSDPLFLAVRYAGAAYLVAPC